MKFTNISRPVRRSGVGALAAVAALSLAALSACGGSGSGSSSDDALTVGIVTSETGALSTYAKNWENGFMAGLDYLTDGTMEIDGKPIKIVKGDDTGEASVGTTVATDLLGKGARILTGPAASPVGLAVADLAIQNDALFIGGVVGTTDLIGMDDRVFAPQGNTKSGDLVYTKIAGDVNGKTIASVDPDYEFGQTQAKGLQALFEPLGATVKPFLVPTDTVDFTTVAHQIKQLNPDWVTTPWVAAGQQQLYKALGSQGVLDSAGFFAYLFHSDGFATIGDALGTSVDKAEFSLMYYPGATGNEKDKALQAYSKAHNHTAEYDDSIGWTSAEMVYQALTKGDYDDTASMAKSLKDWSFEGPQGTVEIRGEDNQVVVPRYIVKLVKTNGTWGPQLVQAVPASDLVPPVVKAIGD
jgi:branched-chain amino acid transport system substrate-binding protein